LNTPFQSYITFAAASTFVRAFSPTRPHVIAGVRLAVERIPKSTPPFLQQRGEYFETF